MAFYPAVPLISTAGGSISGSLAVAGSISGGSSPGGPLLELVATTGVAGSALINGTGNIISWAVPNDGNAHRIVVYGSIQITSAETGGQISVSFTDPGGNAHSFQLSAGGSGLGGAALAVADLMVKAGTTAAVAQTTALTVGAATIWCELWGS